EWREALGCWERSEVLPIGGRRRGVGGGISRREEFPRRERKLVALLGLALVERATSIHFGAATPGAAELAVDEDRDAAFAARGGELVGGNGRVDGRDNEGRLRRPQADELGGLWCRHERRSRRLLRLRGSGRGKACGNGGASP